MSNLMHPINVQHLQSCKTELGKHAEFFQYGQAVNEVFGADNHSTIRDWLMNLQEENPHREEIALKRKRRRHMMYSLQNKQKKSINSELESKPVIEITTTFASRSDDETLLQNQKEENNQQLEQYIDCINSMIVKKAMDYMEFCKDIRSLMSMPFAQVQIICDGLDFTLMPEDTFDTFFQEFAKNEDIPYQSHIMLIKAAFFKKVCNLTANPSRNFLATIMKTASVKNKSIIYGLLLPLMKNTQAIGRPQLDIITRIIKESINDVNILILIQELFRDTTSSSPPADNEITEQSQYFLGDNWKDSTIEILIVIFNKKFQLRDRNLLMSFLSHLNHNIEQQPENKKLAQIMLLLVTKHGDDILNELDYMKSIADKINTFMKKSLLSNIESLKRKK
ncbi:4627_t:CDS:2 [Ambispora leptoticha]|uniref:4627_t:CDS:1 n=1 Tax=Ambispora leptoticha TaxID=144679 RepID=A0A9N8ZYY2_9GLOM|nr:4627_t:CDS:2 [Ambispora leptoticha]